VIRNCEFGVPYADKALTSPNFNAIDVDSSTVGLVIEFTSFAYKTGCGVGVGCSVHTSCASAPSSSCGTAGSPATFRGLLTGMNSIGTCWSNTNWSYSVFRRWSDGSSTTPCSGTGNYGTVLAYNGSEPPYTTLPASAGSGAINFALTGTPTWGLDFVAASCPAADIDGTARSTPCDAGAHEVP
jgi:hypothetical protein